MLTLPRLMTIARTTRAGTRNLVREEIKRVKKQLEKVRKWEKKWVVLEECGLKVYRWVPRPMTAVNTLCYTFILFYFTHLFLEREGREKGLSIKSRVEAKHDGEVCRHWGIGSQSKRHPG